MPRSPRLLRRRALVARLLAEETSSPLEREHLLRHAESLERAANEPDEQHEIVYRTVR